MLGSICKKIIAGLTALMLLVALIPAVSAATALPTEQKFAQKIAQFRQEFPTGSYWSDANGTVPSDRYEGTSLVGELSCVGSSCGSFAIEGKEWAWQCHGYAMYLADRVFGSFYNIDKEQWSKTEYTPGKFSGKLYAGDVVRVSLPKSGTAHSVFIYKVTKDAVYYTDCNRAGKCKLDWNTEELADFQKQILYVMHFSGNKLKGTKTLPPQLTVTYHANGGEIVGSDQKIKQYKVITAAGLNMRKTAGTSGEKVSAMPTGTEFMVAKTKKADGYTWGKTTFGGVVGWCVISESGWVEEKSIPATAYYLDKEGLICKTTTLAAYQQFFYSGTSYPEGLEDAASLGLEREGYLFLGWSPKKTGGSLIDQAQTFLPEEQCPALAEGDQEQIYYAVWQDLSQPTLPFTDVNPLHWFYEGVAYTYEKGWMNGVSESAFAPMDTTTRAMLVTVLYRIEGSPKIAGNGGFSDVAEEMWYTDAVAWAAKKNIVNGMGDGTFAPEKPITRAQMAAILFRYAQLKKKDRGDRASLKKFADSAQTPDWAKEAMEWAVSEEIINGIETSGKLHLQNDGDATRAQIATVLMRYGKGILKK